MERESRVTGIMHANLALAARVKNNITLALRAKFATALRYFWFIFHSVWMAIARRKDFRTVKRNSTIIALLK